MLFATLLLLHVLEIEAYHPVFCTDLTPSAISIEALDTELYMLGSRWDTVEMLVSQRAAETFKTLIDSFCLQGSERDFACYSAMRQSYLERLTEFSRSLPDVQPIPSDNSFISYSDKIRSPWTPDTQKLFVASCLSMCWATYKANDTSKFDQICPDPCKTQDVCSFDNCKQLGIFEHQYKCKCPTKHLWDYETHTCIPETLKELRENPDVDAEIEECYDCHTFGTEYCERDASKKGFACVCKPQYTGEYCDEKINACEQRVQHPYLINGGLLVAGDRACNVNQDGNTCSSFISTEGDVYYKCQCDGVKWIPDPQLPYDNCLKRISQCDSIVCIHGQCVANGQGMQPVCICKPGYSGPMCSEWTGEWSEWSPWDKCRPSCGDVRYSVRSRDCQTMKNGTFDKRECIGVSIEYARCAEHPCARSEGTFVNTYFAIRQNAIASSLSTAAVVCALITVIWVLFFWSTASRPLLRIIMNLRQRDSET